MTQKRGFMQLLSLLFYADSIDRCLLYLGVHHILVVALQAV